MHDLPPHITSLEQHGQAIDEITRLWDAREGTADAKRRDALFDLVHAYEERHVHIEAPSSSDMLCFILDQRPGLTDTVTAALGGQADIAAVLQGKRALRPEELAHLGKIPGFEVLAPGEKPD